VHFKDIKLSLQQIGEIHGLSENGDKLFLSLSLLDIFMVGCVILAFGRTLVVLGVG
jgi:hypothetical protein